jgi:hypothetical protein
VRGRLNLAAVEASLRHVQRLSGHPGCELGAARDPLDDRVVDNMLAGYAFVDALVADGVDVLALGQLRHLLELNTLVLCGTDPARRVLYARHLQATERRFYEEPGGGIEDLVEWHARHRRDPVWELAAGACARILGKPQLFVEGNHRTPSATSSCHRSSGASTRAPRARSFRSPALCIAWPRFSPDTLIRVTCVPDRSDRAVRTAPRSTHRIESSRKCRSSRSARRRG